MPSVPINFGTVSYQGEQPLAGSSRLINGIVEQISDGRIVIKRAPGLRRFITSAGGRVHTRGMIGANASTLLVVYDNRVESVTFDGLVTASTDRGALAGTDLVTLARNNASTPQIVCVSPANGAFVLTAGGAPAAYPDPDAGAPNSVCFLDGYFFFTYGNGDCIASGLNSTSIDPLNSVRAESASDGLLRGVAFRGLLFLCGPSTIEVWQNTANPPPAFPFSRSAIIPRGLASTNAVAGWEYKTPATLIWAGSDNTVYQLSGYEPTRVSTHEVERSLQSLVDKSTLRASMFMNNGHAFFALKSPAFTWVLDLLTSTWQERHSYGRATWRGEQSVFHFGDWIVGDETTGYGFRPDNLAYKEDTEFLIYDVTSAPSQNFPTRTGVPRADFNFVPGIGLTGGDPATAGDPTVAVLWSDDGGALWSFPVFRRLGAAGAYGQRISVARTGQAGPQGRKWRLVVSDPNYVGLLGGEMQVNAGTL